MAKNSRNKKSRSSANPRSYSSLYKDDRSSVAQEKTAKAEVPSAESTGTSRGKDSASVDWTNEYAYVVGDLRQLGIVSVLLFAAIIGIELFL